MLTREYVIRTLQKESKYLSKEYGVKRIGLFGSIAKNQANETSDVDIYMEFSKFVGFKFINLSDYLEKLFDRKVDILTPLGVKSIRIKHIADSIRENIIYV